jgi:hypothetical protein
MSLLLDIDGVLIRDKQLLGHVKANCVRYVRSKLPGCKNPHEINNKLYLKYGHTARGLNALYGIDTSDFNRNVYDSKLIDHLWAVLSCPEFQDDAEEIHSLTVDGWDVQLFSNSPLDWSLPVALSISDKVKVASDGIYLKPELGAYMKFNNKMHHTFVDDSLRNLDAVQSATTWRPVHFSQEGIVSEYPTVNSIWSLGLFLRSK